MKLYSIHFFRCIFFCLFLQFFINSIIWYPNHIFFQLKMSSYIKIQANWSIPSSLATFDEKCNKSIISTTFFPPSTLDHQLEFHFKIMFNSYIYFYINSNESVPLNIEYKWSVQDKLIKKGKFDLS